MRELRRIGGLAFRSFWRTSGDMIRRWRGIPVATLAAVLLLAPLPFASVTLGWLTLLRIAIAVLAFASLLALSDMRLLRRLRMPLAAALALATMAAVQATLGVTYGPWGSWQAALSWLFVAAALVAGGSAGLNRDDHPVLLGGFVGAVLLELLVGVQLWRSGTSRLWGLDMPGTAARLRGTFVNPDHLALFLEIALAVVFAWSFWALRRSRRRRLGLRESVVFWVPPLVLWFAVVVGLALTGSRAGLLAAAVGTGAQGVLIVVGGRRSWRWAPAGLLLFAAGLGYVAFSNFEAGFGRWVGSSAYQVTSGQRRFAYAATLDLWKQFPLTGSGLGSFRDAFPLTQPPEISDGLWNHAHNDWLELLATGGVVGALIFLLGLGAVLLGLAKTLRRGSRSGDRALGLAALGAIFAVGFHEVFDFGLTMPANQLALAVLVGAALCAPRSRSAQHRADERGVILAPTDASRRPARALQAPAPWLRWAALLAVVTLGSGSLAAWTLRQQSQRRMLDFLERSLLDLTRPELSAELKRDYDPVGSRLRAARSFLAQQLDPAWILQVAELDRSAAMKRSIETLEEVVTVATAALERRPASWEASLLLGAASYLGAVRDPAADAVSRIEEWEPPLLRAREMAPGRVEASRYLAYAYVGEWSGLSPEQRSTARPRLRDAFADPRTLERLLDPWLLRTPDTEEAMSVIPDVPRAWRMLQDRFVRRGRWTRATEARRHWRRTWPDEYRELFDSVKARVSAGDVRRGRDQYRRLVSLLWVDGDNLGFLKEILAEAPAGAFTDSVRPSLESWLAWCLDLCYLGHCPLSETEISRLVGAAEPEAEGARAHALLASGDLPAAELVERRAKQTWTPEWSRYHVAHAAALVERGELEGAESALLQVSPEGQEDPVFWQARLKLAERKPNPEWAEIARKRIASHRGRVWAGDETAEPAQSWKRVILPEVSSSILELRPWTRGLVGGIFEAALDDRYLGSWRAVPGQAIEIPVPIDTTAHLVTVTRIAGDRLTPGRVRVR